MVPRRPLADAKSYAGIEVSEHRAACRLPDTGLLVRAGALQYPVKSVMFGTPRVSSR